MCIHKIAFPAWSQSAFTYFSKFQRLWKPCVLSSTGALSAQEEVNRQTAGSLLLSQLLSRSSGRLQPLTSLLTTHAGLRPKATWFTVMKDRTVVLCLGPNLNEDAQQRWYLLRGTGRSLWVFPSALTLMPGGNDHNKISTSSGVWHTRASWGPLSIVRHNTGIQSCPHLTR